MGVVDRSLASTTKRLPHAGLWSLQEGHRIGPQPRHLLRRRRHVIPVARSAISPSEVSTKYEVVYEHCAYLDALVSSS